MKHAKAPWPTAPSSSVPRFPPMVHVETNNICNIRCIHCPQSDLSKIPGYHPQQISWPLLRKVIDEVADHKAVLRFTNDGEPLLHPDIIPTIHYIHKKEVQLFTFNTNGLLLEGAIVEALLKPSHTRTAIEVSLDALYKPTYEKIRVRSNYIRVMRNIFNFLNRREQTGNPMVKVMVSIVRQPESEPEVDRFRDFWEPVADRVIIREYVDTKGLLPSKNQKYSPHTKRWPCLVVFTRIVVGPDGRVRFCPDDWRKESVIGDLRTQSLQEIWRGQAYRCLRTSHMEKRFDIMPCNRCKEWQVIRWGYDYSVALKELFKKKP